MVILLNGAFGIGKTTVGRLIARRIPRTALYDPEPAGVALQIARRFLHRPVGDFQDLALWRRSVVSGVRLTLRFHTNVVVPMAFSNPAYLEEIQTGLERFEPSVVHFCLVAPLEVVEARLRTRGTGATDPRFAWQYQRAAECCSVHQAPLFAEQVPTEGISADEVASILLARLGFDSATPEVLQPDAGIE